MSAPLSLTHLQRLEAERLHTFREVVVECDNPVLLYSVDKDGAAMPHLRRKTQEPKQALDKSGFHAPFRAEAVRGR